ncbi:hypothetical protein V8G54_022604 [Vigna mungo]|uniref:Uncharacterized protein n=1 Tax=Vigna mungo TaxID=3915 RepID=A0AAQ3N3R0_VIGMU
MMTILLQNHQGPLPSQFGTTRIWLIIGGLLLKAYGPSVKARPLKLRSSPILLDKNLPYLLVELLILSLYVLFRSHCDSYSLPLPDPYVQWHCVARWCSSVSSISALARSSGGCSVNITGVCLHQGRLLGDHCVELEKGFELFPKREEESLWRRCDHNYRGPSPFDNYRRLLPFGNYRRLLSSLSRRYMIATKVLPMTFWSSLSVGNMSLLTTFGCFQGIMAVDNALLFSSACFNHSGKNR